MINRRGFLAGIAAVLIPGRSAAPLLYQFTGYRMYRRRGLRIGPELKQSLLDDAKSGGQEPAPRVFTSEICNCFLCRDD